MMVQCDLSRIVIRESSDHQYIYLKEKGGERAFPIVIGIYEAVEINRKVTGLKTTRPLTHDLLRGTVAKLGGRIVGVEVDELRDNTFHAKLILDQEGSQTRVDCRPSDAIALAVAEAVPIAVEEAVLDQAFRDGQHA
jgi:hypothetical protein